MTAKHTPGPWIKRGSDFRAGKNAKVELGFVARNTDKGELREVEDVIKKAEGRK